MENWLEVCKNSETYAGIGAIVSYLPPTVRAGGSEEESPTQAERRQVIDLLIHEAEKVILRGNPVGALLIEGGLDREETMWRTWLLALEETQKPMPPTPGNGVIINELLTEWYCPADPTVRSTFKDAPRQPVNGHAVPYFVIH